MTSPLKVASNRRNAQLSTGPSLESRAWTRFNGLTLGLRSKSRLLPGETEEDFGRVKDTWVKSLNPLDPAECALVDDIIMADWFHQRALRIHHQHLMAYIAGARTSEDIQVDKDINLLFHDRSTGHHATYGLGDACCGGPRTSRPEPPDDCTEPFELVTRIEGSAKGCKGLADCWRELKSRLVAGLELQANDRLKAVRMLGRQPVEVVDDQRVWLIFMGSYALHPLGKDHAFEDLKSDLKTPEREAFLDRILSRWPAPFDAADTATVRKTMLALVDENLERLEAKVEGHRGVADEQAVSTAGRLAFEQSPDGERLRRFELANERRKHRCLDAFWKYRREMDRAEDGGRRTEDAGEGNAVRGRWLATRLAQKIKTLRPKPPEDWLRRKLSLRKRLRPRRKRLSGWKRRLQICVDEELGRWGSGWWGAGRFGPCFRRRFSRAGCRCGADGEARSIPVCSLEPPAQW